MIGPGLLPPSVLLQHRRIHTQPLGQPGHRHRRRRAHLIRHEPKPRQRTELDSKPQAVSRAPPMARVDERDISCRQSEEPDQIIAAEPAEKTGVQR
jgi:hypothetical protein